MNRALGITGAAIAMLGLPFVLAAAVPSPDTAQTVPATPASLTVQAESGSELLEVVAVGPPPTAGASAVLASSDGSKTAGVTALDPADCAGTPHRLVSIAIPAGASAAAWCLRLDGLPDYGTVSGQMVGSGSGATTALTLTVNRRKTFEPAFEWGPFAEIALGLLAGLILALTPTFLTANVPRTKLRQMLAVNEARPPAERVGGLRAWVVSRESAGDSVGNLIPVVARTMMNGPPYALKQRQTLAEGLSQVGHMQRPPVIDAAEREAQRADHVVADFLDGEGKPVPHPATRYAAAIKTLAELDRALANMESQRERLGTRFPSQVQAARMAWLRVTSPDGLASVHDRVEQALAALDNAQGGPVAAAEGFDRAGVQAAAQPSAGPEPAALEAANWSIGVLVWMTVSAVLGAIALAWLTVKTAAYDAKPAFGGWSDEFTLFTAAFGSGIAATILGLVAPWRDLDGGSG